MIRKSTPLVPITTTPVEAQTAWDAPAPDAPTALHHLRRLLRHRLGWCALLCLVLGAAGAYLGYSSRRPLWLCSGMVQVNPVLKPILRGGDDTGFLPVYDLFVQSQMTLIRSPRVIDLAMQSPEWVARGRSVPVAAAIARFRAGLGVQQVPRSQMVMVTFEDADPAAAAAAVRGVLAAYNKIHVESQLETERQRRELLEARRQSLSTDRAGRRDAILRIAREYGTDDLRPIHQSRLQDLARLESALADAELALAASSAATQPVESAASTRPSLTPKQIASRDEAMRQMLRDLDVLKAEAELRRRTLGPNHPRLLELQLGISLRQKLVDAYAGQWVQTEAQTQQAEDASASAAAGRLRRQLEERRSQYEVLVQLARRQALELGRRMLEIETLRKEEQSIDILLAQTEARLDELRVEAQNQNRIQITSYGDQPQFAADGRPERAVLGAGGGAGAGLTLMLLVGLLDRRFRSPDDARAGTAPPLLGVLPSLPDGTADREQRALAAHCVHQVRTLLQLTVGPQCRVLSFTSPAAGSGKTTLSLALGISWAAAGCRALLIDCDLVGGGLSARCLPGRCGTPPVAYEGLLGALHGGRLTECVVPTGTPGLDLLPASIVEPADVGRVSASSLEQLLAQARERYDIVLIDTGPSPGSLEASAVCAAADGVVLIVRRGESRSLAEQALAHLRQIGANMVGMVFNRAHHRDMRLATTTVRLSSARYGSMEAQGLRGSQALGPGPLADAVADSVPRTAGRQDARSQP